MLASIVLRIGGKDAPPTAAGSTLRIRFRNLPENRKDIEGFDLRAYQSGGVYDVDARLAELLVVLNYAELEMRRQPDCADDRPGRVPDRRR
ncbi:MAG: hypothetical protein IT176_09720 [Acidobacteria bacterium]|nr:hypothetical protein [Acidobacteriota bacterium]